MIAVGVILFIAGCIALNNSSKSPESIGNNTIPPLDSTKYENKSSSRTPDYMKIPTSNGKCDCFKHLGFVYLPDPAHPPDAFCYYKKTQFTDCPSKGPSHGPIR